MSVFILSNSGIKNVLTKGAVE